MFAVARLRHDLVSGAKEIGEHLALASRAHPTARHTQGDRGGNPSGRTDGNGQTMEPERGLVDVLGVAATPRLAQDLEQFV